MAVKRCLKAEWKATPTRAAAARPMRQCDEICHPEVGALTWMSWIPARRGAHVDLVSYLQNTDSRVECEKRQHFSGLRKSLRFADKVAPELQTL